MPTPTTTTTTTTTRYHHQQQHHGVYVVVASVISILLVLTTTPPVVTTSHAQSPPVISYYPTSKEFCTTWTGTKLLNITDPTNAANKVHYCVADCLSDEICAELHMPIFPDGRSPAAAGVSGTLCRNFPDPRDGVCLKKNTVVMPILSNLTSVNSTDPFTHLNVGIHCFDAPPNTTEVSTKCGPGKISRNLCRGFASVTLNYINVNYNSYGHMTQCGTDPASSLKAYRGHCVCDERLLMGQVYDNDNPNDDVLGMYSPSEHTTTASLIPNKVCLVSPGAVDTDNGCPAGQTWQANPAPVGYVCTVSGDGSTSLPWCPDGTVLTSMCSNPSTAMLIRYQYGCSKPYGLPNFNKCYTMPTLTGGLMPPAPLTCVYGGGIVFDNPTPTGKCPYCQTATGDTYPSDSQLFIGSNCPISQMCVPLPTNSTLRDYRCGSGYRCRPNPCAAEFVCAATDYDPATNLCATCTAACPTGRSCQRSVYGNDTDYGCANGFICLPNISSCPEYTICQRVSGFAPASDSRCPTGMVCGPSCPIGTHNCTTNGTGNSHGCPSGTACQKLRATDCGLGSFVNIDGTCQMSCGSGACQPTLVNDIVTTSNFHQTCPAGMACGTCSRSFLCANSNGNLTNNSKCMLAHHPENECSPICPDSQECIQSPDSNTSTPGCPLGFTCQVSPCPSGLRCRALDTMFETMPGMGAGSSLSYLYAPCGPRQVCAGPDTWGGQISDPNIYYSTETCNGPVDPNVMSMTCPSYFGVGTANVTCNYPTPANLDGLSCFSCPVGEQCMYDPDNQRTDFGCRYLGFRCLPNATVLSQTYPCGEGFICRDDGISGTHNASCPAEFICDNACPPGLQCQLDYTNGATDIGCAVGQICQYTAGGTSCTNGWQCVSNEVTGKGFSDPLCEDRGHTCEPCDVGEQCDPAVTSECQCISVCGTGQFCIDDGVASTHTVGCPSEQVCRPACPVGTQCMMYSLMGVGLEGCSGDSSCGVPVFITMVPKGNITTPTLTSAKSITISTTNTESESESLNATASETNAETPTLNNTISLTISETINITPAVDIIAPKTATQTIHAESPTMTKSDTPPVTPPPATTLPPPVQTYFGYGPNKVKYPDYTPTPIVGVVSGIPLLYSDWFKSSLYAARFLVTDPFSSLIRVGVTAAPGTTFTTRLSLSKTSASAAYDGVTLSKTASCTSNFVDPTSLSSTTTMSSPAVECGLPLTCKSAPTSIAAGNPFTDSVFVRAGPIAFTPTCAAAVSSSTRMSGLVYSTVPFTQGLFQSYALLSDNIASHFNLSATAAATAFTTAPNQWTADTIPPTTGTSVTGVTGTSQIYLIGNEANPTASSAPIAERQFAPVLINNSTSNLQLKEGSGKTVFCALPDQTSYTASFVAPGSRVVGGGIASSCFAFNTVDEIHAACDAASSGCIGFTTVRVHSRELPLCLHLTGTDLQAVTYSYDRVFYKRPVQEKSCSVGVQKSGKVAVYIQQTAFGVAQAVVRVDGSVRTVCGGSQSFTNGFAGKSGRCQLYALCYAGSVSSDSLVTVSVQGTASQSGCENTFGALITQTSVDSTQVAATTRAPIERLALPGAVTRPVRLPSSAATSADIRSLPFYVYNAINGALDVTQTGFDCGLSSCPASVIQMRTQGSCQKCGGTTGFYRNGRAGESDQCTTGVFCGGAMSLFGGASVLEDARCEAAAASTQSLPFSGHVAISVDPSSLRSRTTLCTDFNATLYITPSSSSSSSSSGDVVVPPFPLLSDSGDGYRTLLTAPSTLSESAAITYAAERSNFTTTTPSSKLKPLFITGPFGNQVHAIYSSTLGGGTPQTSLHVNSTLACVVDHNAGLSSKCVFPIPRGSIKVKILVAQNDFAADGNELSVSFLAGTTTRSSTKCGGLQKFGREAGAQEKCTDYRACVDTYMYDSDAEALSISDGVISIDIPAFIRPRGCNFTASILVVFEKPAEVVTPFVCSTYECPGERKCLPYSSVCDQIQDCASNVDEEWCTPWRPLDTGYAFCVPSYLTTNYTDRTYSDCRRLAAINTTSAFALIGSTCVVYSSTISATLLANPNDYLCAVTGAVVHVRLAGSSAASFGACTSSIKCNGHGTAKTESASSNTTSLSCSCSCTSGFTGEDCSERLSLSAIKTLVVALATTPNASLTINRESVASALTLNSTLVGVECDTIVPSPRSVDEVYVECTITSTSSIPADSYVHRRKLLSPKIWAALNADFTYGGNTIPQINYITARTTMQPVLPMPECAGNSCINRQPFTKIRVTTLSATALTTATLSLTDDGGGSSTTSSSSRSSKKVMSCTPAFTDVGGGCVSSTCDVAMDGSGTANVSVSGTAYADPDVTTGVCTSAGVSLLAHGTYGDVTTTTSDTVVNTEEDYSWFLIGAIMSFTGGWMLFTVLCIAFGCIHSRRIGAFYTLADTARMSTVAKLKTQLLSRLAFVQNAKDEGKIRADRFATVSIAFAIMCAIGAMFLTIYYVTAYNRDSNFSVMYEEYTDSLCSASPTASMPRRIFSVPRASTECTKMSVTGETVGVVYADGYCMGVGGEYNAILQTGGTFLQCMDANTLTVQSGTCLKASELDPDDTRDVYVQLSCSTASQIIDRTTTISVLTTIPDDFTMMTVSTLSADLQYNSRVGGPPSYSTTTTTSGSTSTTSTVYQFPYLAGGNVKVSTSTNPTTVVSTAISAEFDGVFDAARIVYQQYPKSFQGGGSELSTTFADTEASLLPYMAKLDKEAAGVDLLTSSPQDGDYPVGYTFGGFGTSSELTWRGAGPLAHRHYDVMGTDFDVTSHLPPTIEELVDGDGFTISMYLRVTNNTQGFAFAVTDAFENAIGGTVYTLDRLAEMIDNGQPSSSWFNTTYRVYASLYVSGPGRQLTFAHADPDMAERVELLDWDLERIGADHLFNGLWHHVAVVYRVENGKLRAQLIIDGSTSYAKEGWSVCANRIPTPIQSINGTAPVYDLSTDKVTDRGVLVVGYFNGGVYGLTATPSEMINTDFLATGTYPMRQYNAFPRVKTLVLGCVLVVMGGVALLYLAIGGTVEIKKMLNASSASESRETMRDFLTIQKSCIMSSRLFGKNIRRRPTVTSTTTTDTSVQQLPPLQRLKPIRLTTALRWTGLGIHQFASIPAELSVQTQEPGEQLLLILYNIRKKTNVSEFTVEEWNTLVEQDQVEYSNSRRCFCLSHKSDAVKDATLLGGGTDLFMIMMASTTASSLLLATTTVPAGSEILEDYSDDEAAGDDVEHRGGGDGAAEVTGLDVGGGGGDGVGGMAQTAADQSSSVLKSLADVVAPMIVVFQSMYVWSSSIQFPSLYDDYFGEIFSFVSIDVAMTFPGIPSIATPLAQMALGFLIVSVVIYFIFEDHRRFESSLAKYMWRRDVLECEGVTETTTTTKGKDVDNNTTTTTGVNKYKKKGSVGAVAFNALHTTLPTALTDVLIDKAIPEPMVELVTLPVRECRTLDLISGRIPKVHEDDTTNYDAMGKVVVSSMNGVEYTIVRDAKDRKHLTVTPPDGEDGGDLQEPSSSSFSKGDKKIDDGTTSEMKKNMAGSGNNNNTNRASSIAPSTATSGTSNDLLQVGCNCWRHPNVPLAPVQQSDIYPFSNPSSCCCVVNGRLCGAQVGQMYVCNDRYTNDAGEEIICTFGLCALHCRQSLKETIISQLYGVKRMVTNNGLGWLVTVVIIFAVNTIYTPFLKTALMILACHPYYQCEFEHCWTFMTQKFALAAFLSASVVLVLGVGFPVLLLAQLYRRRSVLNLAFFGVEYKDRYVTPDTRGPNFSSNNWFTKRKHLMTSEWSRFGASDNSALAQQYSDSAYRWLLMPAIALVFKVVVLIPAVFLEPRSWEQRLGSATVEVLIAAFYFSTNTQLSPILLMTLRAASVHQLLVLGLQNVDLVTQFDSSITISMGLIGVTLSYVAFSIIVFLATVAFPIFATRTDKSTIQKFLNKRGFDYSSGISLYLEPGGGNATKDNGSGSSGTRRFSAAFDLNELKPRRSDSVVFDDIQSMSSAEDSGSGGVGRRGSGAFFNTRRRRSSVGGVLLGAGAGGGGSNTYAPTTRRKSKNDLGYSLDYSSSEDTLSHIQRLPQPTVFGTAARSVSNDDHRQQYVVGGMGANQVSINSLEYSQEMQQMGGRLDSVQTVTFADPPITATADDNTGGVFSGSLYEGALPIRRRRRSTLASSAASPEQLTRQQNAYSAKNKAASSSLSPTSAPLEVITAVSSQESFTSPGTSPTHRPHQAPPPQQLKNNNHATTAATADDDDEDSHGRGGGFSDIEA